MSAKDGGPAFPREDYQTNGRDDGKGGQQGMTLRDYFAAAALPDCFTLVREMADAGICADSEFTAKAAKYAYELADAMLRERAK